MNEKETVNCTDCIHFNICALWTTSDLVEDETHKCCFGHFANEKDYRRIKDDEIVIKKSKYKELKKYRTDWLNDEKMHLQAELEDTEFELGCSNRLFQKVCEEKKELEEQLERYKNKAKFYYERCKSYGCENFYDAELEWWED